MKIVFVAGEWAWPSLRPLPKQNLLIAGFVFVARRGAAGCRGNAPPWRKGESFYEIRELDMLHVTPRSYEMRSTYTLLLAESILSKQ